MQNNDTALKPKRVPPHYIDMTLGAVFRSVENRNSCGYKYMETETSHRANITFPFQ